MDIELLKTFLEVNRTRHFGRAADNLYLTSAAVSARVKHLEQQLGVQLFIRYRGNIQLTSEGERLVPHAENLLNAWARTIQEVQLQPEMDARLYIGATSGLWQLAMQEKLQQILDSHSYLAVQAEGYPSDELVRRVVEGSLDLVLLYDPPANTELKSEKIGELKLVLASNETDLSLEGALGSGYVYVDWGTSFATFHAKAFGERPQNRLHVNLASIALTVLEKQAGAAYLPQSTVSALDNMQPINKAPSFKRPIYVSYRENNPGREMLKGIVEMLRGISI